MFDFLLTNPEPQFLRIRKAEKCVSGGGDRYRKSIKIQIVKIRYRAARFPLNTFENLKGRFKTERFF